MIDDIDGWRSSAGTTVALALASSVFFATLFWLWERRLLWMLIVILPPIWSPVISRRYADDASRAVGWVGVAAVLLGLAAASGVGLLIYLAS